MEDKKMTFEYTYSAPQQDEVKRIREKYQPKEPTKLEQLRQLDRSAAQKGTTASLIVGILSALVLGIGMCCTMVWGEHLMIPGIIIGVVGIVGVSLAYPLYMHITKKEREKIAPEILRLADELERGEQ